MKVVEGKFKQEKMTPQFLIEKFGEVVEEHGVDELFLIGRSSETSELVIATDQPVADQVFLLEAVKQLIFVDLVQP